MEMIRLAREEEVYDREAVLGRDATSVFPTEAKAMASSGMDALREAIGVKKFISESEVCSWPTPLLRNAAMLCTRPVEGRARAPLSWPCTQQISDSSS